MTIMDHVTAVRRRLVQANGIDLEQPYFMVEGRWSKLPRCTHENYGVRLDEVDRLCYCRGCNLQIDPFEALVHYAASESRLVLHADTIRSAQQAEIARKEADKARRPFVRNVTGHAAVKDLTLKAEPIIGYKLTLECGHVGECGPNRIPKRMTCRACQADALRERRRT